MTTEIQTYSMNEYADFWRYQIGVNVLPAISKDKACYITPRDQWYDAPIPEEIHNNWKELNAFERGICIFAGKVWHNANKKDLYLVSMDCDNQKAIEELSLGRGVSEMASKTLVEQHKDAPDKAHVYFYSNTPVVSKSSSKTNLELAEKIDHNEIPAYEVKARGKDGIIIVSPSIHQKGQRYEIVGIKEPRIQNNLQDQIASICQKYKVPYLENNQDGSSLIPMSEIRNGNIIITEGNNRHLVVLRYAESFYARNKELEKEQIFEIVNSQNKKVCSPPLPESEIRKLVRQAMGYISKQSDQKQNAKQDQSLEKVFGETESEHEQRIVDFLIERYDFKTLDETKEVLFYENGIYKKGGELVIEKETEKLYPEVTSHRVKEILQRIKRRTFTPRAEFDSNPDIINLKNGLFDLNSLEFKPHSTEYLSMTQIPVNYNPEARCPNILQFLSEILYSKDVKTILAFIALAFQGNTKYQQAFAFLGSGSNGKSTFDDLVSKLIGDTNISSVTLQQLESDRFALAELFGKRLNICGDLSRKEILDTGNFKKIVTGDMITTARKHEHPFQFRPRMILSFSTNVIPKSAEQSDGYFRRWIIITFPYTFDGEKADRNILSKLITDEELSGLLNLVIQSIMWVKRTGKIPMEQQSIEKKQVNYERKSDPVQAFCDECVAKETGENAVKQDVYNAFVRYCKYHNLPKVSIENFGRRMSKMTYDDIRLSGEGRPRAWKDCKVIGFKGVENPSQSTLE